jgi:glycosyltransferase involved in cell wall biosynthesis
MQRGLVTYSSAQSVASLRSGREALRSQGYELDFLHYSKFLGLPRRPNRLVALALEEVRILVALLVGRYDLAIIPAQLARPHLLRAFLLVAQLRSVDVWMYWHDCAWILEKIRERLGADRLEGTAGLLRRTDIKHLVASPQTFQDANQAIGIASAHCIWNSVPDELDDTPPSTPDDQPPLIANVASIQLRKAPELFVDTARHVCARHPSVEFIWVGGEADSELRHYIRSSGLEGRVKFVGWSEDPRRWVRKASALLLTSRSEAFGLVVAEAFAASRVVIAFGETGAADAVGDAGEIIEPFDTVGAGQAVLRALRAPAESRISGDARRRYEMLFSPEAFARRLAQVLSGSSEWLLTNQPSVQPSETRRRQTSSP